MGKYIVSIEIDGKIFFSELFETRIDAEIWVSNIERFRGVKLREIIKAEGSKA